MQFVYDENAGSGQLSIEGESFKHIFKARRHKSDKSLFFRNLKDENIYEYKTVSIDRKKALLALHGMQKKSIVPKNFLHIGWCVVDPKTIEKVLPLLNEMGVGKITFIYCDYSQKSFSPNIERLKKILINSSSQCGRSNIIELDTVEDMNSFLKMYPESFFLDFSQKYLNDIDKKEIATVVIGCEGGFSENEREKFDREKVFGFDSDLILKSETALLGVASKVLL